MKSTLKLVLSSGWISVAACAVICFLLVNTVRAQDDGGDGSDLSVTINQPSDDIIYDDSNNAYILIGNDSSSFSFDCTVEESPSGTFYYTWDFGSGDPSESDQSEDSDTDPVSFSSNTQVTVNVEDDLDDGTVCASGSDTLTVSQATINYDEVDGIDDEYDGPIYNYIDDDATLDSDGNYTVKADITITTNAAISSATLGELSCEGDDDASFEDDNGDDVTEADTDDSGTVRVTLVTSDITDELTVEID